MKFQAVAPIEAGPTISPCLEAIEADRKRSWGFKLISGADFCRTGKKEFAVLPECYGEPVNEPAINLPLTGKNHPATSRLLAYYSLGAHGFRIFDPHAAASI
jgi:hypothetical protein